MELKRVGIIALVICVGIGSGVPNEVNAMKLQEQLEDNVNYRMVIPLWNRISTIIPDISVVGNTLYPEVSIKAKSSLSSITGTMYLEKYSAGRWTSVASWSLKGTGSVSLSKSYIGTSGVNYRTRVVVTVDGETATAISGSCEI